MATRLALQFATQKTIKADSYIQLQFSHDVTIPHTFTCENVTGFPQRPSCQLDRVRYIKRRADTHLDTKIEDAESYSRPVITVYDLGQDIDPQVLSLIIDPFTGHAFDYSTEGSIKILVLDKDGFL